MLPMRFLIIPYIVYFQKIKKVCFQINFGGNMLGVSFHKCKISNGSKMFFSFPAIK